MAHSEKCPICNGSGKVTSVNDGISTAVPMDIICHGCGGKGWIEIADTIPSFPVQPNYPPPTIWPIPGTTLPPHYPIWYEAWCQYG